VRRDPARLWKKTNDVGRFRPAQRPVGSCRRGCSRPRYPQTAAKILSVREDFAFAELAERGGGLLVHDIRRGDPKKISMNQNQGQQNQGGQHQGGGQHDGKDDQRHGGQQGGQHTPGQQNQDPNRRGQPGQQGGQGGQQGGQR
jgi:hypothetical protein